MNRRHRLAPLPALLTLALAASASGATAVEGHGTDLFAGYSFAKLDETSRHGANLAVGFDLVGPLSGFVDLGSHWGSESGVSLNTSGGSCADTGGGWSSDYRVSAGVVYRFGNAR